MTENKFDDSGLASSYLLLTVCLIATLYFTSILFKKEHKFVCKCKMCSKNPPKSKKMIFIALSLLSIAISVLFRNIFTIKINKNKSEFDPYSILMSNPEDKLAVIKKSYKKLLKIEMKNLRVPNLAKDAHEAIKNLNKAFGLVENPSSMDKWLNDSSKKELIIAIPSVIFKFSTPFLIFYSLIIICAIPVFFLVKHTAFKQISATGSFYSSNEAFFEEIDHFSEIPDVILQQIYVIIGKSEEFNHRKWKTPIPEHITKTIETEYGIPVVCGSEGYLRLLMYLTRIMDDPSDRSYIAEKSLNLIDSFVKISFEKESHKVLEQLFVAQKAITQCVPHPSLSLLQYPDVTFETSITFKQSNKSDSPVTPEAEKVFLENIVDKKSNSLYLFNSIPRVNMSEVNAFAYETEIIDDDSLGAGNTKSIQKEGDSFLIHKEYLPSLSFKLECEKNTTFCHTPYNNLVIPNKWYIYTLVNNKIKGSLTTIDSFQGTKNITIPLSFSSGKENVKICVISNGYFNNDEFASLNIKYI